MHTCRDCNESFATELALELHRDKCERADLFCEVCGTRFGESRATRDGWHYTCPDDDCEGEGIGDQIKRIDDIRAATQ
jgi:hypothetical protein